MPRLLTVFLSLLILVGGHAFCTTIYIPDTYPTIQAGIDAAVDGDTVLVSDGIYTGDGNRDIDFNGKAIVLKSENGPGKTIIDCDGSPENPHRGFHFHCGEDTNSVVDGFTIRGGFLFRINYPLSAGGAIFCDSASPRIENCALTDNFGRLGAIAYYKSMAIFRGCTIGKNIPSYFEIFIWESSPEFENCILADYYGIDLFHISYSDLPNLSGCNLFTVWGIDSLGSVADLIGVNGNFFADPRFCKNDVFLQESSPCLPENNDIGILIGALGASCEHCDYIDFGRYRDYIETVQFPEASLEISLPISNAGKVTVVPEDGFWQNDTLYLHLLEPGNRRYTIYAESDCDLDSAQITVDFRYPEKLIVPDDYADIRSAVRAAHNGDTVYLRNGNYKGEGNRDIWTHDKTIVVLSESDARHTIINCQGGQNDHHFGFVISGSHPMDVKISGLTIKGAFHNDAGAIKCETASLEVENCRFIGNYAADGGAINAADSTSFITISNCIFTGNRATFNGGAVYCAEAGTKIDNCIFEGNQAGSHAGGGIYLRNNRNTPQINNTVFKDNYAYCCGGAVYCVETSPVIDNCTFKSNITLKNGGGLSCSDGHLMITHSEFVKNSSSTGGAILVSAWGLTAQYCLFAGNKASRYGGAVWAEAYEQYAIKFNNCTFVSNQAPDGSVLNVISAVESDIINCIISNNTGGKTIRIPFHDIPEFTCCNIFGNEAGDWILPFEDQFGINGNISADPRFCNPVEGDFHIASISPCAPANNECNELIGALEVGCTPTDADDEITAVPLTFSLSQNYPNPFNAGTDIKYSIPNRSHVAIEIYNLLGQKIKTVVDEEKRAGHHTVTWDATDNRGNTVASGIYFYRIKASDHSDSKKMLLLK